jgi:hypothetical protein
MSVGPPIDVNINVWGYLQFLTISFVWIIWVQYATDNIAVQRESSIHRPVLIFQPTVNSRASDKQGELCRQQHYSFTDLRNCYVYESGILEVWRRWRGSILATQRKHCSRSDRIEHKIPPNFDTLWVIQQFKWLTGPRIYGSFGMKGLIMLCYDEERSESCIS